MALSPNIVWFQKDLRLVDNPAFWHAAQEGKPILPLYIYDKHEMGAAQKVWLHHSLTSLMKEIPLILRKGNASQILQEIQAKTGGKVYYNRCYEPNAVKLDNGISFNGSLLIEPWNIFPRKGPYYKVFTPFWKSALEEIDHAKPLPKPTFKIYTKKLQSEELKSWQLLPHCPNWAKGIESYWNISEAAAHDRLEAFVKKGLRNYSEQKEFPAVDGTSRLSPYLHFGQISPRQIWNRIKRLKGAQPFLRQLFWREFSYHLLYHFPQLPSRPFNMRFSKFQWKKNDAMFDLWTKGMTGYPIVDAGMRQLWQVGWMHNRVRMMVASFLTKDLLIPWQEGAKWFWDTLVDADLANNSASWQWVAGCGADAAPFFRIFSPILQGQKFDPQGKYVKQWVPELRDINPKVIHDPSKFNCPDYPDPIVNHQKAREEALKRYTLTKRRIGIFSE